MRLELLVLDQVETLIVTGEQLVSFYDLVIFISSCYVYIYGLVVLLLGPMLWC